LLDHIRGVIDSSGWREIELPSCEIRCTLLSDGRGGLPVDHVFEDVPRRELAAARRDGAFAADVPYNCLLVRAPDALVLVDTGLGAAPHPFGGSGGRLWHELTDEGVAVADVDIVVITHGHLDHIGGLTNDGVPAFPRARYVISEDEWSYWTAASILDGLSELVATPAREQLPPLEAAGVLERFSGEIELTEQVRLLPAPGHSPAHVAVEVGQTGGLLFAVDALLHPLQVEHPESGRGLDQDPEVAVESRVSLLARAAERNHVVTASHWDTDIML
jgi:glyoxylase-like metal-dependent hydrolase (beta-lactamase superfamily II)